MHLVDRGRASVGEHGWLLEGAGQRPSSVAPTARSRDSEAIGGVAQDEAPDVLGLGVGSEVRLVVLLLVDEEERRIVLRPMRHVGAACGLRIAERLDGLEDFAYLFLLAGLARDS